jgi:hypothetical protein
MQHHPQDNTPLGRIERQLDKLDELTRTLATRQDLAELRKEMVQQAVFEPRLSLLASQIQQLEKRMEDLEKEQSSRSERFWSKISPIISGIALLITLMEFLSHVKLLP